MQLPICTDGLRLPVSQALVALVDAELGKQHLAELDVSQLDAVTLNFRDPDYTPRRGGYHPVEIRLSRRGSMYGFDYITDFSFVGTGWAVELAKELDFDLQSGVFEARGLPPVPIEQATQLYRAFEANFICYHQSGAFQTSVDLDFR